MDDYTGMYRENILDHYRNPRNKGVIRNADIQFRDSNPLCGDVIEWFARVEGDRIRELKFTSSGCAISRAASSMLAELVEGKKLQEILDISNQEVFALLGVQLSAMRVKCALLGLKALQKAIITYQVNRNE